MKTLVPPVGALKLLVFLLALVPALLLWWNFPALADEEAVAAVQQGSGLWALNFLLLTLSISPLRALTQQHWLLRLRRMLGLFAFGYAVLHLWAFAGLANAFSTYDMLRDISRQPLIVAGLIAFVLLIPLAATSNSYAVRRLGGRRWQELQRTIYPIALLACLHFLGMREIDDLPLPLSYGVFLGLLLWWRVQERRRKAQPEHATPAAPAAQAIQFYARRPK